MFETPRPADGPSWQGRLFVAVELPDAVKSTLGECQRRLAGDSSAPVRWVEPTAMHLTLKFLGSTDLRRLSAASDVVATAAAGGAPLALEVSGLGAFPNLRRPRVVWVGLSGDLEALADVQSRLEAGFESIGFTREGRTFSPHLTLGRVRDDASTEARRRLGELIVAVAPPKAAPFHVAALSLMQSTLTPRGAIYSQLASFSLGPSRREGPDSTRDVLSATHA